MKSVLLFGVFAFNLVSLWAQVPTITSFSPLSGAIGTTVIITGTNFSGTATNNAVFFGATKAVVSAATASQLTVSVPTGATYESISVLTNGLQAYSNAPFLVTFGGAGIDVNSFAPKVDLINGLNPISMSIGDLDGDGKPDVVEANFSGDNVSVFRNTGTVAGVISYASKVDFTAGSSPGSVALADIDGDGKKDLVVANIGSTTFSIFRNTSSGIGSISFASKDDFNTGANPNSVAIGDFDGDGKVDVADANEGSTTVSVRRNTSSVGSINFASRLDFTVGTNPISVSIGDFDGDHKVDIVAANLNSNTVSVLMNTSTGAGSISYATKTDFTTGLGPNSVSIGDLDGDGKLDLAVVNRTGGSISVLRNSSAGVGSINFALRVDFTSGTGPWAVSLGDLDGDSKVDMAVANITASSVSVFRNTSTGVGSISYATNSDNTTAFTSQTVSIADLDGDGKNDLAVPNSILRNTVAAPPVLSSFSPSSGLAGASVVINGVNFSATPANNIVKFNGTQATVTASTSTSITTSVPVGATTGAIAVTVGGQTGTSTTNFTVLPVITSFNPTIGTAGTSVVITGTNFDTTPTNNIVKFNGTTAVVTANTTISITTSVPTGATAGPITLTVNGQTATSATNFKIDTSPPTVTSNSTPATIAPNTNLVVSASFTDDQAGIASPIRVQYRPIAGAAPNNFITLDMTPSASSSATATIPSSAITELGVEYKFLLTDGVGNDNSASQTIYKTGIIYADPGLALSSYPSFASGKEATNYRIISIPVVLTNNTANGVFSDEIGDYDPTAWRMFKYNGTRFDELNGNSVLIPGEGYWFIAISSSPLSTGPGTSVNVSTNSPFTITLNPGWNQIGNPYNFDISWADVVSANPAQAANLGGNNSTIRVFRGTVDNRDVLKSLEGGFVKYLGTSATPIKIPVAKNLSKQGGRQNSAETSKISNSLDQPSWEIMFNLKEGNVEYNLGGLGMRPDAKEGFDYYDDFNSPRFLDYLEVKFPKKYVGMTYTKDVVPTSENYVWQFSVESNLREEITSMSWDNSYFGATKGIYLLDMTLHKATYMNDQNHYEFNHAVSKDFKVVFGDEDFVKQELLPSEIVLYDPYPNPFVSEVSIGYALPKEVSDVPAEIEVYNSVGSRISQVQTNQPGVGSWVWKSDQQSPGFYFVRLKAGNQSVIKKVLKR